jgi:molecular chaperone HscB
VTRPQRKGAPAPTPSLDHFQRFGLPRRFELDIEELERRYHERSKASHPDRVATADAATRVAALNDAMARNEAYRTLRRPVPRAEYLLGLYGVTIGDNEQLEVAFLAEVLAAREELGAAQAAGDTARLAKLERAMRGRWDDAVHSLGELFARVEQGERDALALIKRELVSLRYLARYLEQLDDPEE